MNGLRATLTTFALLAVSCSTEIPPTPSPSAPQISGGPLRVVTTYDAAFGLFADPAGFPAALDPHLDWPAPFDTLELLRCCLGRQLLSTNGKATDQGGARLHPDLAAQMPEVSPDGVRWTFRLREGMHYAPPFQDVEITAPDFVRTFHRLLARRLGPDRYWLTFYLDIVGAADYVDGRARSISGLESPDPYTLVIRLTEPAGDLAARVANPFLIPIPPSPIDSAAPFGVADGHDDGYGRFLVSSGPYMLEGAGALDYSLPPDDRQPVAGLVPGQRITLVRNPTWSAATDQLRAARPDRIELYVVPALDDAIAEVAAARADLMVNTGADPAIPEDVAEAVRLEPSRGRIFVNEQGTSLGITMNLALPPFDDIHVRKAVNHAVDRRTIIDLLGGAHRYRVAHHIVPDSMEDNLLIDYRPYGTADGAPDLDAARAEMKLSAYDTDGDGMCDATACQAINALANDAASYRAVGELLRANLSVIGLDLDLTVSTGDLFGALFDPSLKGAMLIPLGWGRDYLSASNFFVGQFYSPAAPPDQGNGSLVGKSPEQLREWGYEVTQVPNVDSRIETCVPLTGPAQFECWASLDQYLMENVVPSVPIGFGVMAILGSRRVVGYAWDELTTAPSYDGIELAPRVTPDPASPPPPSVPTGIPTPMTDPELEGVWETPRLTRESMAATLTAAGLDPEAADLVAENEGVREHVIYRVEIEDGRWTITAFPDGEPVGVGWLGTYEIVEPGTVTATDHQTDCTLTYQYDVSGDALTVDLIDDPCGEEDELFQTVIFESAPFTRVE